MNEFQYTFSRHFTELKKNEFESIFTEIRDKINIYKKQYELTTKSYLKEWRAELSEHKKKYERNVSKGEKIYNDIIKDDPENENNQMYAEHKSNLRYLHEENYEIETNIENKYRDFFDLFSKAILTAVHSLSETELLEIVKFTFNKFPNQSTAEDISRVETFLESINFLIENIKIEAKELNKITPFLSESKLVRNRIIHNQSKVTRTKEITRFIEINKKHPKSFKFDLEKKAFKIIAPSFLENYFDNTFEFYHQLCIEREKLQEFKSILNQLEYYFYPLDNNIIISELKFDKFTPNNIKSLFYVSSKNEKFPNFKCVLELQKKESNEFNLVCHNENEKVKKFFSFEKVNNGYYLSKVFSKINISDKIYKTKLYVK